MRILDRLAGPNPPKIIVIDPRQTFTAKKADVHLALKVGTNIPVMNGLLNLIIQAGQIDSFTRTSKTIICSSGNFRNCAIVQSTEALRAIASLHSITRCLSIDASHRCCLSN